MHYIPLVLILAIFLLSLIRHVGSVTINIWQVSLMAAVLCLLTNQISLKNALLSINFEVIFFLIGMFILGSAIEKSGLADYIAQKAFFYIKLYDYLLLFVILLSAVSSAILMNDTIAAILSPIIIAMAKTFRLNTKKLLIISAMAITIGACASPIGSPQNILIISHLSVQNPFILYAKYLFLPTALNLALLFLYAKFTSKQNTLQKNLFTPIIKDKTLSTLSIYACIALVSLIALKSFILNDLPLLYIALVPAAIVVLSKERFTLIKNIDYKTIVFFISLFILIRAFWDSNVLQLFISRYHINVLSVYTTFILTTILSQFVSNVPLVTLYLQVFSHYNVGFEAYIALSVASSIAGNIFLLGAASNIIIAQSYEKHKKQTITSLEFFKYAAPLTLLNIAVYFLVFTLM